MTDTCQHKGCETEAENAVWTTLGKDGNVRTTVQWAYWQDEKKPPKKADLLCSEHTGALLSGLVTTMGGSQ